MLARRLGLEALAWFGLTALFLFVYVRVYNVDSASIVPHLGVSLLVFASLALARLLIYFLVGNAFASLALRTLAVSLFTGTAVLYYGLVVLGLESWGRVITWDLIASYAAQLRPLAEAFGISLAGTLAALAAAYLVLFAATWLYVRRFDWVPVLAGTLSRRIVAFVFVAGTVVCGAAWYEFAALPSTAQSEPLSLTFFPSESAQDFQGHAIDRLRADRIDRDEDAARAAYRASPDAERRNVLLIVVDALRPDHLGINGYTRDTTPHLDRLAREGNVRQVKGLRSSCSDSACGLYSIAASKFVHQFSRRPFTLQQVLQRHGYRIHMILGGDHLGFYGIRAIYGEVDSYFDASMAKGRYVNDDRVVVDRAATLPPWDGVPVMMQFHFMSTHPAGTRNEEYIRWTPHVNYFINRARHAENLERVVNHYDNGVFQADALIHELLRALEAKGYLKNALVVITADHGESLGENGAFAHANSVWEEQLKIPLLMIAYGYRPAALPTRTAAAQVDIAPTILAELGMAQPTTWIGVPLQVARERDYTYFQERYLVGLMDYRDPANLWRYWVDGRNGAEYAYNITLDPREQKNIIDTADLQLKRDWRRQYLQQQPGATGTISR